MQWNTTYYIRSIKLSQCSIFVCTSCHHVWFAYKSRLQASSMYKTSSSNFSLNDMTGEKLRVFSQSAKLIQLTFRSFALRDRLKELLTRLLRMRPLNVPFCLHAREHARSCMRMQTAHVRTRVRPTNGEKWLKMPSGKRNDRHQDLSRLKTLQYGLQPCIKLIEKRMM